MKNLQHNKGFTLIELMVSVAIMAIIIVGVGGIMASNNLIYKKEKADLTVQGNAQDIYNKVNEDIMQAKHIYIEGYVCDNKVEFSTTKVAQTTELLTSETYLLPSDNYILKSSSGDVTPILRYYGNMGCSTTSRDEKLNAMSASEKTFYENLLATPDSDIETALQACTADQVDMYYNLKFYNTQTEADEIMRAMSDDEKAQYASFLNRVQVFDDNQISEEATFLNSIPTESNQSFESLKTVNPGTGDLEYSYLYITKLVIVYSQKINPKYCDATTKSMYDAAVTAGNKPKDDVTVTYTFGGGAGHEKEIGVNYTYKYMTELNTGSYAGIDNDILTKQLNYATDSSGNVIPGCEAQIDAENDSIKLYLYFADNSMTYTDRGMVSIRNSYVLHDAK